MNAVDFICAEDTRVTVKLLNHYGIKKPMISYHEHSERHVSDRIMSKIMSGESCAVDFRNLVTYGNTPVAKIFQHIRKSVKKLDACKEAAKTTGFKKSEIYSGIQERQAVGK